MNEYASWIKRLAEGLDRVDVHVEGIDKVDVVVCRVVTNPLMFADNVVAPCSKCIRMVQFRPHAPNAPKVCDHCMAEDIAKWRAAGDGIKFKITENTLREIAAYSAKRGRPN